MKYTHTHARSHAGKHEYYGTVFQLVNFIYMFHNDSITAKIFIYRRYNIEKLCIISKVSYFEESYIYSITISNKEYICGVYHKEGG